MTSRGYDSKATPVRPSRSHPESSLERAQLARKWAYQVVTTTYVPLPYQDIEAELLLLVDKLFDALHRDPFAPEAAAEVAERLVAINCVGSTTLARTLDILGKALLSHTELRTVTDLPDKVIALLSTLSGGYLEGARLLTLRQQDDLNRTLASLDNDSRIALRAAETRLDALLTHVTVGIGVTDSAGEFLSSNPTLVGMLGYSPIELTQRTLFDLLPAGDEMFVRDACASLQEGVLPRLRQRRRLIGKSGDEVPVTLTMSVLREPDEPERFLVMVQDDSELDLLQRQLTRQSLHDVLTSLPNRQFFTTRLETMLHRAHRDTGATIFHLGLDAFAMIADGLGRQAGDQVLKVVADRLKLVVGQEKAVVARLDSDEFGILIENSATTPDVATMVDRINRALGEPMPIDGHTVAMSACVGVVHRPRRDLDPTELLRASDLVLRRAKARGRRQWELFDARWDADERADLTTAVTMASAWESGAVEIQWRPRVDLRGGRVSGVEAGLRWDHPRLGLLDHRRCVALAERTGLMLSLGDWLLHSACSTPPPQFASDLPLIVAVSDGQAVDPDLADRVLSILSATEVAPGRLSLGVPAHLLRDGQQEPTDNVRVLLDEGVNVSLSGFGAAGDVVTLEELPIRSVRLDDQLTTGRACRAAVRGEAGKSSLLDRALTDLVASAHEAGASVTVDGVHTPAQADWWRHAGADMALGDAFPVNGESTLRRTEQPVRGESTP